MAKTKKFFAVEIIDSTCNVAGHESGIYGRGDYSWMTESLNGGNGEYNMTEEEALEVKADFERIIKERGLEWASVSIDSVEIPYAETMQDVADYYNEQDCIDVQALEAMIEQNGWVSDCGTDYGICHNDTEKVIVNDEGEAVVVPMEASEVDKRREYLNQLSEYERELMIDTDCYGYDCSEYYGYISVRTCILRDIEYRLTDYIEGKICVDDFDKEMNALESAWEAEISSYTKPSSCKLNVSLDFESLVKYEVDMFGWESDDKKLRDDLKKESLFYRKNG